MFIGRLHLIATLYCFRDAIVDGVLNLHAMRLSINIYNLLSYRVYSARQFHNLICFISVFKTMRDIKLKCFTFFATRFSLWTIKMDNDYKTRTYFGTVPRLTEPAGKKSCVLTICTRVFKKLSRESIHH